MSIILKNKNDGNIYEFQSNEFPADSDKWQEASLTEKNNLKRNNIKDFLISSRKSYLKATDFRVLRFIDEGTPYPDEIKSKRILARQEINEIEACTTLTALNQFSEVFE